MLLYSHVLGQMPYLIMCDDERYMQVREHEMEGVGEDGRWLAVQSYTDSFELRLEESALLRFLGSVQHHEDEVARLRGRNDLPTAALALGGTLDDTG